MLACLMTAEGGLLCRRADWAGRARGGMAGLGGALAILLLATCLTPSSAQGAPHPPAPRPAPRGVKLSTAHRGELKIGGSDDQGNAWQNWALNCQGCHLADGKGTQNTSTKLSGRVAKYLWVPGGRAYLIRVPGVATSDLANDDLAAVVNWMLLRFDKQDIPVSFKPYTGTEVGRLRHNPLRLEAGRMHNELLEKANQVITAAARS